MHVASLIIAGLSLSVIPGYVSEESIIDIQFASRTHDGAMVEDQYRYTYGTSSYIWLPFVVYPDFFVGINGGYVAPGKKVPVDVTHLVIQRFMLDATEKIKKHTGGAKMIWPQRLIKCPE